jgi:homeobox protein cut-like
MGRIHDLERERAINTRQLSSAKATGQQLQRDNLQLYEKIRYLQSYSGGGSSGSSSSGNGSGLSARHLEDGLGDMEGRYKSLYEQQTNPFTQFSQAERARKYNELTTAEKITLNTTRALLSSKPGRTFAFFYVLGLHLLVFSTVLHWSHSEACTNSAPPLTNHHAPPAAHMHGFVAPSPQAASLSDAADVAAEVIAAAAEVN